MVIDTPTSTIPRQQRRWRFDVTDYERLHASGFIPEDARTELVQGEIRIMEPIGSPHGSSVSVLNRFLVQQIGARAIVWPQNRVKLGDRTLLLPDIALLRPEADDYFYRYPEAGDVLLIVEVSITSLRYDRKRKVPLYARHGIPEVWIAAISERVLEVYREPEGDRYASVVSLGETDTVAPLALPDIVLDVGEILRARQWTPGSPPVE